MLGLWLAYGIFISRYVNVVAAGADSSGYMNHARALAQGGVHLPARIAPGLPPTENLEFLYAPLGFLPKEGGQMLVPSYPPGLSLLIMAAAPLGWSRAGDIVMLLHALAGVALVYLVARQLGLAVRWAVAAATIIAVSPLYFMFTMEVMSDMPALVWCTAAVATAWAAQRDSRWALATGVAVSVAVLIRPNNALILAPVAISLGFAPRRWLLLALGGLPGAIFFACFNRAVYGSALVTGYGDVSGMFLPELLSTTLLHYAQWLPLLFTPVVAGFFLLPWAWRATPRAVALLATWALGYLVFYCTYRHTHETWWYLRFVLPAAPALVIGGLLGTRALSQRFARPTWFGTAAWVSVLVLTIAVSYSKTRQLSALRSGRADQVYADAANWVQAHTPANATMLAMQTSGALFFYTDHVVIRSDQLTAENTPRILAALANEKRPIYAVIFHWEEDEFFHRRLPGQWERVATFGDLGVWRFDSAPPAKSA